MEFFFSMPFFAFLQLIVRGSVRQNKGKLSHGSHIGFNILQTKILTERKKGIAKLPDSINTHNVVILKGSYWSSKNKLGTDSLLYLFDRNNQSCVLV